MAIADDGTLYVSGGGGRVHRIDAGGRVYFEAGNGTSGDEGDGGPATSAQFFTPAGLAIGRDGSLYVSDASYDRVRSVGPHGVITALAGRRVPLNSNGIDGENGPALAARFNQPNRLAVAPDGTLYIADEGNNCVRKVTPPLPGLSEVGDTVIASLDGSELYVFNSRGRHERTVDTLAKDDQGNPIIIWEFDYDDAETGFLTSVTDRDGNVTTFERGVAGGDLVITGPHGQQTVITLDANGYVASIANPGGETTSFQYTPDGLMTKVADPRNNSTDYTYGAEGRLESTLDSVGLGYNFTRVDIANGYQILAEAGGVATTHTVEFLSTGEQIRTTTLPDGTQIMLTIGNDASETVIEPDGTIRSASLGPDPRFGMQAPLVESATITTPIDGLVGTLTTSRTAVLADPADPLSLITQTETVTVNGRATATTYDVSTRTYTETTPGGRQILTVVNEQGRPVQVQFGDLMPVDLTYDQVEPRVTTITQGARLSQFTYDASGNIETVSDPTGRTVSYGYDAAGRVTSQTILGGATTEMQYDAGGNVTSIMPPVPRTAHEFAYDSADRPTIYAPPNTTPPLTDPRNTYEYHLSGQLSRIKRPDGQIFLDYDLETGDLIAEVIPTGQRSFFYNDLTGRLERIVSPSGTVNYTFDGTLLKSESWTGAITGSVNRVYDGDFRVASKGVNGGAAIAYTYNPDDLVLGTSGTGATAHTMTISRDPETGFVMGSVLGVVTDSYTYDAFGEVTRYEARVGGSPVFIVEYTRDDLGRITERGETIEGVATEYVYTYDLAGRLSDVHTDGVHSAHYEYDANGNRLSGFNAKGTFSAVYDDQDRLLSAIIGGSTIDFEYTANGDLSKRTIGSDETVFTYDLIGNLLAVAPPSGPLIEYVVDGNNRRIGRKEGGSLIERMLYDGRLALIAELDATGQVSSRYVHALDSVVPTYLIRGGIIYRILSDHLGSPRLVIDTGSGAIVQRTNYDEFGNVVSEQIDPIFDRVPVGFATGLRDDETGLIRFGARDYDPTLGRWVSKDPIGFSGGDANLYAYVGGDPINATDPTGLATDYSIPGLSASQEQSTYLRKQDFVRAQNRYRQLTETACKFLGKGTRHHVIPSFTGVQSAMVPLDRFAHISLLHPLLNIVARMSGLPSTYANASRFYPELLAKPANQKKFAEVLLLTTRIVDSKCGTQLTEDTRDSLKGLGWL